MSSKEDLVLLVELEIALLEFERKLVNEENSYNVSDSNLNNKTFN